MRARGWTFAPGPCVTGDPVNGAQVLSEVYLAADPHYTGRVTVPVLWDKLRHTIVSNESAEILRMFNSAFDQVGAAPADYYPALQRTETDALNDRIYRYANNGVYRAGFATTQQAYDEAVGSLFETLDWLEERLSRSRYLLGDRLKRPTSGCSPRWCGSMPCTTATSSAISAASWTIRHSGASPATSIISKAWPRP